MAELLGAAALVVAVAARLWLAQRWVLAGNTDELFHRVYIESIRGNGHRVPPRHERVLGPGYNSYPALMHVALSYLPPRWLPAVGTYLGFFLDASLAAATSWLLVDRTGLDAGHGLALAGAYLLAPGLTLIDLGPRAFGLTPRIAGATLFGWVLVLLLAAGPGIDPAAAAAIVALVAAMVLTSKFAIQALLLLVPIASLLLWSWVPLALAAGGLAAAYVVSGGWFARQLAGQLSHLEWYVNRYVAHVPKHADWRALAAALRGRDLEDVARHLLISNPITSGLIRHTHLFVALALTAASPGLELPLSEMGWLRGAATASCAAAVLAWLVIAHGRFRILGEAERYLEFVFPAAWLLLWSLPGDAVAGWLIAAVFVGYGALFSLNEVARSRIASVRPPDDRDEMVAVARQLGGTVLALNVVDVLAFVPVAPVCMYNGQESLRNEKGEFMRWFLLRYPYVHPEHLHEIVEQYDVGLILARHNETEKVAQESGLAYDLSGYRPVASNSTYRLYATGRSTAA